MRCNEIGIGRIFVYAVVAIGSGLVCSRLSHAAPGGVTSAVFAEGAGRLASDGTTIHMPGSRRRPERGNPEAGAEVDGNDAKVFAAQLKHYQGRHFAKRKRQFAKQQLKALRQKKARMKARQFAAARRRAAEQASKHNRRGMERDGGGKHHVAGGRARTFYTRPGSPDGDF